MEIGELIALKAGEQPRYDREFGAVIGPTRDPTLTRVFWNTGYTGYILSNRIERIQRPPSLGDIKMKVGDLIRVKAPLQQYLGIAIAANHMGGVLVRSFDGEFEYWVYDWMGEVVNGIQ